GPSVRFTNRRTPHAPDRRGDHFATGRGDRADQGLRRQRLPAGQSVPGAVARRPHPGPHDGRVLPGRRNPAAGAAVVVRPCPSTTAPDAPRPAPGSFVSPFPSRGSAHAMTLTEQLTDYVHAAFSGLYVVTQEADEAEREIGALASRMKWKLAAWDIAS